MPECPTCHQTVEAKALNCPYCRTPLKAFGHPGIPLHRATGSESLCETCTYHADDTCNYPQRPDARECTMYQNLAETQQQEMMRHSLANRSGFNLVSVQKWIQRNPLVAILLALALVSLLLAQ
ncbi:zinc ribbon domain-containing protein [Oscillatoria amoena NRMC-F 0135]|nr:zinc ribbon domain-containing protein [Desertifilum sp.]MDI9636117.1 zinc ribbon domain-containing protein [Geitlerinema splendidum]MDL5047880.1 zinc ribbon domain-containing protein [Oscillatoria amoena NRMC-F 0135]